MPATAGPPTPCSTPSTHYILFLFVLCLTVWGVEPDVTHQTSWLGSTYGTDSNTKTCNANAGIGVCRVMTVYHEVQC